MRRPGQAGQPAAHTAGGGLGTCKEGKGPSFPPPAQQPPAATRTAVGEAILWARGSSSLLWASPGLPKRISTDWLALKTAETDLTVLEVGSLKPTVCVSPSFYKKTNHWI